MATNSHMLRILLRRGDSGGSSILLSASFVGGLSVDLRYIS